MTIDPALAAAMQDTVTLERQTGVGGFGAGSETYGPPETIPARVVVGPHRVRTLDGELTVASAAAWLAGVFGVKAADKITLPNGKAPKIIMVQAFPYPEGVAHEKVTFG